jgi:hypothetical protein
MDFLDAYISYDAVTELFEEQKREDAQNKVVDVKYEQILEISRQFNKDFEAVTSRITEDEIMEKIVQAYNKALT